MPTLERVNAFIKEVVHGDHVLAIDNFYHSDATMQENLAEPRGGRDALIAHEKASMSRISHMHTHQPETVLIDENEVVILWTFDALDKAGITRRLNEIALQTWSEDRIKLSGSYMTALRLGNRSTRLK